MNTSTRQYLAEDEIAEMVELAPRLRVKKQVLVGGRPARIMLADDDPEMRSLLADGLKADGYDVIAVPSGASLFEEIGILLFRGEAVPVDLIISDERMPGMMGSELLAALRRAEWPTPFILITGFGDRETHERAQRLGAAAVFDKPFDLDELRQTVLALLLPRKTATGPMRLSPGDTADPLPYSY
jgi:DNA-binding response OmpR family regulator